MTYQNSEQHKIDLAALREKGFSNLPSAQRDRLTTNYTKVTGREPAESHRVGDLVGLDSTGSKYAGQTFKVEKVNPRTYLLAPLNGGIKVRASRELVTDAPVTSTAAGTTQSVPIVDPIVHLACGTVVRIHNQRSGASFLNDGDLGVVLVDKGERVNVAPLGGFEDRYGRVPRRMLTVVDPKSLVEKPF